MDDRIRAEVNAAFHRFLRSQEHEIDPESPLYGLVRVSFAHGYCAGAQAGVQRMGEEARKIISGEQ